MMPADGVLAITAIVHTPDGVRFVTTGTSREAVTARIAEYVRERSDGVLPADAAREVGTMLALGNIDAAITLYFERVGERWDDERLELVTGERHVAGWTSAEPMVTDARR
jgi:hypothetical protein